MQNLGFAGFGRLLHVSVCQTLVVRGINSVEYNQREEELNMERKCVEYPLERKA